MDIKEFELQSFLSIFNAVATDRVGEKSILLKNCSFEVSEKPSNCEVTLPAKYTDFFFFFTIKVRLKILLFSRVFKHTEKPALEQKSIFGVLCSNQLSKKCSFYLSYSPKKFYKKMNFTTTYQECSSSWSFELLLFAFFSCY